MDKILDHYGELSDELENLVQASKMPFPPKFHLTQITAALEEKIKLIRKNYVEQTGENPWEFH